jgi:metal-sulfur cluster biosynthetic enzyme
MELRHMSRKDELELVLSQIIDPETGLSIVRMDIIHDLVERNGEVSLVFRPSSPVCPMAYSLANAIKQKISSIEWVDSVTINVENFVRADHLQTLLNG